MVFSGVTIKCALAGHFCSYPLCIGWNEPDFSRKCSIRPPRADSGSWQVVIELFAIIDPDQAGVVFSHSLRPKSLFEIVGL
jgi:hypothetical protein